MKYLISIKVLLVVSFLYSISIAADNAEWLGEYVGSTIPGYEILKSNMMATGQEGGPTSSKLPTYSGLAKDCKKNGGKAIVNVRLIFSLGDVSWEEKDGSVTKISPGAFGGVYGDCVYLVRPRK